MTSTSQAAWKRLGLEFLVVVIGIVAALAVDDWRQARADRALEEHLLTSLLADLAYDEVDAELQVQFERADRDAVDHLLAVFEHPAAPDSVARGFTPDEIDQSLDELWDGPELEVADATFSEMISTGSFRVVRNRTLRREISTYYQSAERLLRIPQRQIDPRPELLSSLAQVGVVPGYATEVPDLIARLRSDPSIATHALRMRRYRDRTLTLNSLGERRTALILAVRAELDGLR